jgi:uncharacterized protein (TIGR00255 family)
MTGFGAADGLVGRARVSVEVRTVNHRFFNPSIKLPGTFGRWEGDVRETLRRQIARGHVTLTARAQRDAAATNGAIDETRFASYVQQLAGLKARYGLGGELDLATVLRLPDVIASEADVADADGGHAENADVAGAQLIGIVDSAVAAMTAMRAAEGTRLALFLAERVSLIEAGVARIRERAPARVIEARDRLREAVRVLTEGVAVDEQRIAQEIALLADRLDVAEELDRFTSHIAAFRATLRDGATEGIGKRLGFLVQEMLREANTTGSKANDAPMLQDVVGIKEELERIREQVDNLE